MAIGWWYTAEENLSMEADQSAVVDSCVPSFSPQFVSAVTKPSQELGHPPRGSPITVLLGNNYSQARLMIQFHI